jgi:integrase
MASISRRGNGWFAQVRRKGHPHQHKSFRTRREALTWATAREVELDATAPWSQPKLATANVTLGDIIRRYLAEVTPTKRSAQSERLRLKRFLLSPICALSLGSVSPEVLGAYRDARLRLVKPATLRRELAVVRHALEVARREWGYAIGENPVSLIRLPAVRDARERRPSDDELERLRVALGQCANPLVPLAARLALETGLRRSEILGLDWRFVCLESRTAHVPVSKSGSPRTIPLTDSAVAVLRALGPKAQGQVVPLSANALRLSWERAKRRAGVSDLRFHDLRHEAISRFAEMGLNVPELALISGHRDYRMLQRYTHLRPADLAAKLRGRTWGGGFSQDGAPLNSDQATTAWERL